MPEIAEIIFNGVAFDVKNWNDGRVQHLQEIPGAVERLFDELERRALPYTLVGGVALLQYVDGRNTQDVDLILSVEDAETIPGLSISERDEAFATGTLEGLTVDLLVPSFPIHRLIHERFTDLRRFGSRTVPTATVEGMLLLKLFALPSLYRQFQMTKVAIYEADILSLMSAYRPEMPRLVAELAQYVSESDLAELRKIVAELEAKIAGRGRFGTPEQ